MTPPNRKEVGGLGAEEDRKNRSEGGRSMNLLQMISSVCI